MTFVCFAKSNSSSKKLSKEQLIINNINEQKKLLKKAGIRGQQLEYRLINLELELNKQLVSIDSQINFKSMSKKQKAVSSRAKNLYLKNQRHLKDFQIKYPKSKYHASLIYNFSILANELNLIKEQLYYLSIGLPMVNKIKNPKLWYNYKSDLAEVYYNEKKHKQAVEHYQEFIGQAKGSYWYPKYLHNYSWSLIKLGKKDLAINNLRDFISSYDLNQYVDIRESLYDALIFFYATQDRYSEAESFLAKYPYENSTYYLKLSHFASESGQFHIALRNMNRVEKIDETKKEKIIFLKMKLYFDFKRMDQFITHLKTINESHLEKMQNKNEEMVQILTVQYNGLLNKLEINHGSGRENVIGQLNEIMGFTSKIDSSKMALMKYTLAEYFYEKNEWKRSF
jgi:tetratricopeptide (TPR) repeat protein